MLNVKKKIFIGGCDRSGTTLLASMLASAPGVLATPESQFKNLVLSFKDFDLKKRDVDDIMVKLKSNARFRVWLENPYFYKRLKEDIKYNLSGAELLEVIVSAYCKGKNYCWVDHTPNNIQDVGFLKKHFPESHFIHIVRDGRAVAASVIPLSWGPSTSYYAASWWAYRVSFGCAAEVKWPDNVHRVSYELLINNPEKTLKEICEKVDIPYSYSMLSGSGFEPPRYTKKQHVYVGQGVKRSQVESWRKKLTDRDIQIFESQVGGLLSSLDYNLLSDGQYVLKPSLRILMYMHEFFINFLNTVKNKIRIYKLKNITRKNIE